MQPRIWLACWTASVHCQVMFSFSSTNTPKSFSSWLLSIRSPSSLYLCLGLPQPMCRTFCLALLNFMSFAWAHLSSLSRSLWMASLPSSVLTASHSFVLSANLLRVHSIPQPSSPIKMLNSADPNTESQNHRITESQNHRMVGVGRDLCGSSSPTPLPKQGRLQQAAQDCAQTGLEYLQRRRIHNLPGQRVPVLRHPQREEVLPHVQMELSMLQFVSIAPCPVAGNH